jgi:ArsR family transcriptional regulator, arsenate/arsenite/antimonite-responsive transcriptional repressor
MNVKDEHDVIELFEQAQPLFIALGDENRQQIIIQLLKTYKLSVNEITADTELSRPAISHHLKILRDANLVSIEKRGTLRLYHLSDQAAKQVDLLENLALALRACTKWQDTK